MLQPIPHVDKGWRFAVSYNTQTKLSHKMRGVSLVEVMISLVLGAFLILAVTQIYTSSRLTQSVEQAQTSLQARAQFATSAFEHVLRQLGHTSCSPVGSVGNWVVGNHIVTELIHQAPVRGWEFSGTGFGNTTPYQLPGSGTLGNATNAFLPLEFPNNTLAGADLFVVSHITSEAVTIAGVSGTGAAGASQVCHAGSVEPATHIDVQGPMNTQVPQGSVVFFERNCQGGDIFVKHNPGAGFTRQGNWSFNENTGFCHNYPNAEPVVLSVLHSMLFFIALHEGEPSLFRQEIRHINSSPPELLVTGVESMQVTYGVQQAEGMREVNRYVDASEVTEWDNVVAIRIGLLLRSEENVSETPSAQRFNVNGTEILAPNDRRLRMVTTITTALRSKT